MTNISTIDAGSAGHVPSVGDSTSRIPGRAEPAAEPRSQDRAEISPIAHLLSKLRALPEVRQDLIDRVRAEIAAGTADTDEKLRASLDELIDDAARS